LVKLKTNHVASSSLKLLTVSDLKLSSAPRKRVYHFVKGADEPFSKKRGEHDTFVNRANDGTAIPFYKQQKNSDEPNSQPYVAISRFGRLLEKFCKPWEEE